MKNICLGFFLASVVCLPLSPAWAGQSSITESEGSSCMGDDKSRKQTENAALTEARRNAVEYSTTYIQSQSRIENFDGRTVPDPDFRGE